MTKSSSKPTWSQIKAELKHWDKAQLTGLIQDLFRHSQDNRDFLAARLLSETLGEQTRAPYLGRIEAAFYDKRGWPAKRLNLKNARSAIREYQRATSDAAGTLDLMLVYVETGTEFTREFGDIDEAFYDSLSSVWNEIRTLLTSKEGAKLYGPVRARLGELAERADGIGWGYGDEVGDVVYEIIDANEDEDQSEA